MAQHDRNNVSGLESVLSAAVDTLRKWDRGIPLHRLQLDRRHRSSLHNFLMTYFRRRATIDWVIGRLCHRPRIRPELRNILRFAVCQSLYFRSPAPEIVSDTCVRYTKRRFSKREAGFINAVVRRFHRDSPASWLNRVRDNAPESVRLDLAPALFSKWQNVFSAADCEKIARDILKPAHMVVRLRAGAPDPGPYGIAGLTPLAAPIWMPGTRLWRCDNPDAFLGSSQYRRGDFYIQDPATLLAPALLDPKDGEVIGDLCAAPGGKALLLQEQGGNATLLCLDRSFKRLQKVKANLLHGGNTMILAGDAARPPFQPDTFNGLLLDVPCSNTGVMRRRPDVRWRFSIEELHRLTRLQAAILNSSAPLVKTGGRIVYSTCSIEPEENREQVIHFLQTHSAFALESERQLFPEAEHDGAYAALLRKEGAISGAD